MAQSSLYTNNTAGTAGGDYAVQGNDSSYPSIRALGFRLIASVTGPRVTDLPAAYWKVTRRDKSPGDQQDGGKPSSLYPLP